MTPRVTVLIVNCNGEPFLARAITSVLAQGVPADAYEILVVDDGSTDGSPEILTSYQPTVRALRLPHRGLPAACNEGIRVARGRYLIRVDADDECEPDLLAATVPVLDQHPDVAFVTTDRWVVDETTGQTTYVHLDGTNIYQYIAPGVLFRTDALKAVGLYDRLYWEEYDLFMRLLRRFNASHLARPLYRYHRHPGSMTSRSEDRRQGWQALMHKWGLEALRQFGHCEELEAVAAAAPRAQAPAAQGRIAAVAHDAGGCHAILPVLQALKAHGVSVAVWADGPAFDIFEANGLSAQRRRLQEARWSLSREWTAWRPHVVLTGTSCGASLEDLFVAEARQHRIPSVGVLDSWLLYDQRFSNGDDRWAYLPDTLVVMDELAKEDMAALGAPAERLCPLGQPQFDRLQARAGSLTVQQKQALRASLGAADGDRVVLFLSQDMENFYGGPQQALARLGYTEYLVLGLLLRHLRRVAQRRQMAVRLAVKLHPREAPTKYASWGLPVVKDADPYLLMMSADLVVGMDTILLVEAGLLGCPTLSLQPYRKGPDSLVTNRLGLGERCDDPQALERQLEALLEDAARREAVVRSMRQFRFEPGATERVAALVLRRLQEQVR